MTKHSTLINPDDLHYSKIKTFSGNIATVQPDFIGQLLAATDTNRAYRSTGVNAGDIVELLPSVDGANGTSKVRFYNGIGIAPDNLEQLLIDTNANRVYRAIGLDVGNWLELIGGSNGEQSVMSIGGGDPIVAPVTNGQMYFDVISRTQWVSVRSGSVNGWVDLFPVKTRLYLSLSNTSSNVLSSDVDLYFADITHPDQIRSADYTFTEKIGTIYVSGQTEITDIVFPKGRGAVLFKTQFNNSEPVPALIESAENYTGSNYPSNFDVQLSPFNIFVDDSGEIFPAGNTFLWMPNYSLDLAGGYVPVCKFEVKVTATDL